MKPVKPFRAGSGVLGSCWRACALALGLAGFLSSSLRGAPPAPLTNALSAFQLASQPHASLCPVRLEGVVVWTNPTQPEFVLQDASGAIRVQRQAGWAEVPEVGRLVRLEGFQLAAQGELRAELLNNDGLHAAEEKAQTLTLAAGRYPIVVDYFNGPALAELRLDYEGPGLPRQRIPDAALFRLGPHALTGTSNLVHGLDYRCYEGEWEALPCFERLQPVHAGTMANFDLGVRTRGQQVGLRFSGLVEIPRDGTYTFWLRSDDGAHLYLAESASRLSVLGRAALPAPRQLVPGQRLTPEQEWVWSWTEGVLTSAFLDPAGGLVLQLSQGTNRLYLVLPEGQGAIPPLFSRVRANGVCRGIECAGGGHLASQLLLPGLEQLEILAPPPEPLQIAPLTLAELRGLAAHGPPVLASGAVTATVLALSPSQSRLALADATATALVETDGRGLEPGQVVALSGTWLVESDRLRLVNQPVVDNDRVHQRAEKTGTIFLPVGKQPFHVSWFNKKLPAALEVAYSGPELPSQCLGGNALFKPDVITESGIPRWVTGADYRCFEGSWTALPAVSRLTSTRDGAAAGLDINIGTALEDVDLEFSGFVDVPRRGLYTFSLASDDGSRLFVGEVPRLQVLGSAPLPEPKPLRTRQGMSLEQPGQWATVEGTVTFARELGESLELELNSSSGRMEVEVAEAEGSLPLLLLNSRVRVTGVCQSTYAPDGQTVAGKLLAPGLQQLEVLEPTPAWYAASVHTEGDAPQFTNATLPVLTTVEQVKRLSRTEAQRAYPVKIRGVITETSGGGFFIQDATWGIAVRWRPPAGEAQARVGEYWELDGITLVEFAPLIQARHAVRLGAAVLPEPIRPSWDQLINGSLDTLYVEVQGIVASVDHDFIMLLTRQGKLKVWLGGIPTTELKRYENALIRARGCVVPGRNTSQQVEVGQVRLANASVSMEEAPPADPFATPFKHARELLLFDPQAGAVQRVRIAGQVLHERGGEYFVADGTNGLRVVPKQRTWAEPGDWVEAVGFVELDGPSPSLREALLRRTGSGSLPPPVTLPETPPLSRQYDTRRVRVTARLSGLSTVGADQVLELQAGGRGIIARLETRRGLLTDIVPGTRLEVTGLYAGRGGDRATLGDIDSFELLLNSPADIRVLSRPSWWTARHTLAVLGSMAVVIFVAVVWITLLRRQVEERSHLLAVEIQRHEQTERQRALEEERARIARDLHDDLGATLTQIRFLSALESRDASVPESARSQMGQISEKSRQMVASLDEIVWALNPTNDSLSSLATYLCQVAEELFRASSIRCRLQVADTLPPLALTSELRHDLYLAVREALNNVAKHSQASEVWLRIHWRHNTLSITVEDDGVGFSFAEAAQNSNGLANMRQRAEKAGGHFTCQTQPGVGTICRFELPFPPSPARTGAEARTRVMEVS